MAQRAAQRPADHHTAEQVDDHRQVQPPGAGKRIETIVSLTIIEWNRLMFPEDQREKFQDEMIDTFSPPDDDAATVGSLLYISDLIAERKKKYFPNLRKVIVNQELIVSNGNITLNIASAPIESKT